MMEKASEVLLKARELIEDPKDWRPRAGMHTRPFCLYGALHKVRDDHRIEHRLFWASCQALQAANGIVEHMDIADFNDACTHAEVLAALNKAIGLALKAEGEQPDVMPAHVSSFTADCAPALAGGDPVAV